MKMEEAEEVEGAESDDDGIDCEAPLRNANRQMWAGFQKYYSVRQAHFTEIFGKPYSAENARAAFIEVNPRLLNPKGKKLWKGGNT
jgi:hypothetical protein